MVDVLFLRHGKTKGNLEGRYIGRTDEDLCELGREQILSMDYKFPAEQVFSSPLKRCIQTAKLIYPDRTPIILPNFRETDFGLFENKNYEELNGRKDYQEWIDSNGTLPFPKGESTKEVSIRVESAFLEMMKICEDNQFTSIACIIHGGTLMSLMDRYAFPKRDYFEWQVKNGCGYTAEVEKVKDVHYRIRIIDRVCP
ncbi:Alpha-ribazole-5'-phosphate phosphatase [Lachnospiraceae bacterium TWA4]|nr:Alpha-ribazole-5'-phosphate phosphatase [Lachnospiraceae bacterium TWA4]